MLAFKDYQVGEHPIMLPTDHGIVECSLQIPKQISFQQCGIICHPHSLQGGTMQNKVVTTCAKAFVELGQIALRFNFRGVGNSTGSYAEGVGESQDLFEIIQLIRASNPTMQIVLIGFSFGSYVAARAVASHYASVAQLILIAPPVAHFDFGALLEFKLPWSVLQGDADEIVPSTLVYQWIAEQTCKPKLQIFSDVGHFFHGSLLPLKEAVQGLIKI